jgi:hypothetical protein
MRRRDRRLEVVGRVEMEFTAEDAESAEQEVE